MKHCVHYTKEVLAIFPPQYPQYCCFCGEYRIRRGTFHALVGHGPFLRGDETRVEYIDPWKDECKGEAK